MTKNNQAVVARLQNVRPHPNADRLQLANCLGYQIVVGLDVKEGELGVFFSNELQLSREFCNTHSLIRYTDPVTGERKGGFFENNRRVRITRLRGERSEGYWCPIDYIHECLADKVSVYNDDFNPALKEGDSFTELQGVPICNKYYTPATLQKIKSGKQNQPRKQVPAFPKHITTKHLQNEEDNLKEGLYYVTEKLHGTSGRFGYVSVEEQTSSFFRRLFGLKPKVKKEYTHLNGTRNTVLSKTDQTYYEDESFRTKIVKPLEGLLKKDEVIYYEIVGYAGDALIMPEHDNKKLPEIEKQYGPKTTYLYGCKKGECKMFVYRIAHVNEDGEKVELPWSQVKARCEELGIETVPELTLNQLWVRNPQHVHDPTETVMGFIDGCEIGPSTLDSSHIREGFVLRIEADDGTTSFYKFKSFDFKFLEGIIKERDDYVDLEEVS